MVEQTRLQKAAHSNLSVSVALGEIKNLELAERTAQLALAAVELTQRANQLTETNNFLESRKAELEEANQSLIAMMHQREDFVASLTHDLKNPLLGSTRILEFLANGDIELDQYPNIFKQLVTTNKNMLRMIRNVLDVYRHDSGALLPEVEPVDIAELIRNCLDEFSFLIAEKNIDLQVEIPVGLPLALTDSILLRRVLVNLLDNALKFSSDGGYLSVSVFSDSGKLFIAVQDSGPGLSDQQKSQVFQRFWQTIEGRKNANGSGLGLFLSKQIMHALGGDLQCNATDGPGAKFTIAL